MKRTPVRTNIQLIQGPNNQLQVRGLLPGQQLIRLPDGRLQLLTLPTTVQRTQPVQLPAVRPALSLAPTASVSTTVAPLTSAAPTAPVSISMPAIGVQRAVEDFGRLLESGDGSDVTVQVGGVEIPAHSFVLLARCPALSASLRHESVERASGRIVVEGCEPDVFRDLLRFLYTGSVRSLTRDNAFALYRMADRYLVDDLKRLCLEHVQDSMSVETFCDAVRLAVAHAEDGLMERAVAFASQNIQSVLCSEEWRTFIRECPDEANDVLIRSVGPPGKRPKSEH